MMSRDLPAQPGLFLRNKMSLKSALALSVCFILFFEEKHHRALVYPKSPGYPLFPFMVLLKRMGSLRSYMIGMEPSSHRHCLHVNLRWDNGDKCPNDDKCPN